jgi:hypothetical protein
MFSEPHRPGWPQGQSDYLQFGRGMARQWQAQDGAQL